MFQDLIKSALGEHGGEILSNFDLAGSKKEDALDLAKESILGGITKEFSAGNISGIQQAFSSGVSSNIVQGIITTYGTKLVAKLGLSPGIATSISASLIPMVFEFINKNDDAPTNSESGIKDMLSGAVTGAIGDKIGGMLKGKFGF